MTRSGRAMDDDALGLFGFLGRQALSLRAQRQVAASRYCARMALDLARAIVAAEAWRRAARGSRIQARRAAPARLTGDLKTSRKG